MKKQPEALLLADDLVEIGGESNLTRMLAAGELRRLHEENNRLKQCLFQMQEAAKELAQSKGKQNGTGGI